MVKENAAGALTFYGTKVNSGAYISDGGNILGDEFGGAVLKVKVVADAGGADADDKAKHKDTNQV